MFTKNIKTILTFFISLLLLSNLSLRAFANEGTEDKKDAEKKEEGFQPGPFIIDHILDAHEWHICEIGHTHISVPLPVILYSKNSGLHVFMSSKFHHGTEGYNNFYLEKEGKHKGQIVEKGDDMQVVDVPLDLSITKNVLTLFLSITLLLLIFVNVAKAYKKNPNKAPSGLQNAMEPLILFIRDDVAKPAIGEHRYEKYMPYLLTVFFFILINNLMGLIPFFPFGANFTGNIAITMVLALFTFVITLFSSNKAFFLHLVNPPGIPWWLKIPIPLMPFVEILGVFTKPFVLMVRLFANITAGHIIALGFFSLIFLFGKMNLGAGYGVSVVSVGFTLFMGLLELLVAFIQAYVFTLLSALYFGMAKVEHEHHEHKEAHS